MLKRKKNAENFAQKDRISYSSVQNGQSVDGANLRKDWQKVGSYLRYAIREEREAHGSVCERKS